MANILASFFVLYGLLLPSLAANGKHSIKRQLLSLPQHRIINGVPVHIRNYNYYVYLANVNDRYCGGALVHTNKIVTAAHCCKSWKTPLYAYPGITNLNELANARYYVSYEWYIHDQYQYKFAYDLCVVILTENVDLSDRVGLIPIARNWPPINAVITLVGHGITDCSSVVNGRCNGGKSFPLMKTDMVVKEYRGPSIVVYMTPNRPCKGDSGGPWTFQGKLVAVESASEGKWCNGSVNFEASTMITPMPQFLARFGIYPQ